MDVSIETLEGLERKMLVVIPASRVEEKVNDKLAEAAKTARINGFRPGKVPKREIKRIPSNPHLLHEACIFEEEYSNQNP